MTNKRSGQVIAECGDFMLAKECVANLRGARYTGELSLTVHQHADELEKRGLFSFGTPLGEAFAKGAAWGVFVGLVVATLLTASVTDLPADSLTVAVVLCSIGFTIGGLSFLLSARRTLGERNDRGVRISCHGDSAQLKRAYATLLDSPCRDVHMQLPH